MSRLINWLLPTRDERRENRRGFLLCLLSGLFGGLIFHHNPLGLLAWVALVPYFLALRGFTTTRAAVWGTYIFGCVWYYLNLWWLNTLAAYSILVPMGLPLLAIIQSTYFLAFAFPARYIWRRAPAAAVPWLFALLWPGMEFLRTLTDLAFPWNFLGHTQVMFRGDKSFLPAIIQIADVTGTYGVSGMLVLTSASLALGFVGRPASRSLKLSWVAVFALVGLTLGTGITKVFWWEGIAFRRVQKTLTVAAIQPLTSQLERWNAIMGVPGDTQAQAAQRFRTVEMHMKGAAEQLLREAKVTADSNGAPIQTYIMPETTFFSGYFTYDTNLHQQLHQLSRELGGDLFFGADNRMLRTDYEKMISGTSPDDTPLTFPLPQMPVRIDDRGTTVYDWEKEPPTVPMVAAWQVKPETGLHEAVYNKVQLVPFGEMIPLVNGVDWLKNKLEAAGIAGAFKPGIKGITFETSGTKYGAVICFESTFPHLTNDLARAGAGFLCVLTNDAWYDPHYLVKQGGFWGTLFRLPGLRQLASAGPYQHYAHSIYRAVETRRPLVRSANNGISAIIDRTGEIRQQLPYATSGVLTDTIHTQTGTTPYVRWGDWFAWVSLVVLGFVAAFQVLEARFRGRRQLD